MRGCLALLDAAGLSHARTTRRPPGDAKWDRLLGLPPTAGLERPPVPGAPPTPGWRDPHSSGARSIFSVILWTVPHPPACGAPHCGPLRCGFLHVRRAVSDPTLPLPGPVLGASPDWRVFARCALQCGFLHDLSVGSRTAAGGTVAERVWGSSSGGRKVDRSRTRTHDLRILSPAP